MSKNLLMLLAGIVVGWLVLGIVTDHMDSEFLIAIVMGVLLGYGVKKKEVQE